NDAAVFGEFDDVDTVDGDAVDLGGKFQHRAVVAAPFAEISEALTVEHLDGAREVFVGDVGAALRRVHDGAFEDDVGVEHGLQLRAVMRLDESVPSVEARQTHRPSPSESRELPLQATTSAA